jgi:hypothetical protein
MTHLVITLTLTGISHKTSGKLSDLTYGMAVGVLTGCLIIYFTQPYL